MEETNPHKSENELILSLLESLQEYLRNMSSLQSSIVDGYIEEAQCARRSTGILCPDVLISTNSADSRMVFRDASFCLDKEIPHYCVSGISDATLKNVQNEFEKCIQYVVNIVKIKMQINELCSLYEEQNK